MSQQNEDDGGGCGSVGQRSRSSPGSPEACQDLPDHRDQLALASAAGGSVASPSFDVSDFEEHQWYMEANLSARSSRSRPDSSVGADRSFSLVSDSPGPSFATVSGAVCSSGPFDVPSAVAAAHRGLPEQGMKFLWEGGFWQQIFGPSDPLENMYGSIFKRPEAPLLEESEMPPRKTVRPSGSTVGAVHGSFLDAVRDREVLGWKQKRDKERAEALSLWEVLIMSWPSNLSVISQLRAATPAARKSMVEDLLGGKAPATLRKRYRSILGYDLFLKARNVGFPGTEEHFYTYLCMLRDEGKPASSRKAVLEAVTFSRYVLGIPELMPLGESKRCHGSVRLRDFKARVQASPFTVDELAKLHKILFEDPELWNRLLAGSILFCTYGRARWEDLAHSDVLIIDRDDDGLAAFIEVGVGVHKTMGAKLMRGQLLPLVAPAVGVVEGNWVEQYIKVRGSLGLQDPPLGPLMPAPDRHGVPTVRSLDSDEAGSWVRLLLYGSTSVLADRRVSSHSCKCTCISFATKYGCSPDELLLLGYHTGDFKMPLTYGRDSAAPTLLLLGKVLTAIRDGSFKPDCTRSGRFVGACSRSAECIEIKDDDEPVEVPSAERAHPGEPAAEASNVCPVSVVEQAFELEPPPAGGGESNAGTTSSGSSSDSEEPSGKGVPSFVRWVIPDPPEGMCYYEHTKIRTLHLIMEGHSKSFVCGRSVGPLHRKLQDQPGQAYSRCRLCSKFADSR